MLAKQRFYVLDAFRGLSAIFVFLYHMPRHSFLTNNSFIANSGYFVDLFFVLSGFVIYHNYHDKNFHIRNFIKRRFNRLLPLHIYTLLILVLLETLKLFAQPYLPFNDIAFSQNNLATFLPQLFLLNATPFFTGFQWNGQNWSISAEIISYMLFAFSSYFWLKNKKNIILISSLLVVFGYLFFNFNFDTFDLTIDFNYSFIRGFSGFFIGVLTYLSRPYFLKALKNVSTTVKHVLELLAIFLTVLFIINFNPNQYYFLHLSFCLLILLFSFEIGFISTFLKLSLFQKIGLWSYSIYLNHILIIRIYSLFLEKVFKIEGQWFLFFEVFTLVSLCIYSYYTYTYIEKIFFKRKVKSLL
ncbi:acyltransferase family protein [Algibacter miyuki]|uniref:Acyltransferase family protein n=1 Tax=Algibacter miyuki TaxID=1306933 RepID=A0ABV5H2E4_9FLAO|nr:acyltransferase [Algibacter miyuki]MDN3664148.1 acyltransferase [Algibacter miyuki]